MPTLRSPGPAPSPSLAVESMEERLTPVVGFLDPSFGTNGLSLIAFSQAGSGTTNRAQEVAVQPDGKIVVVGAAASPLATGSDDFAIARLNPNGTLDTTFGKGGQVLVPFDLGGGGGTANQDRARAVVLQPDGKILVGGEVYTATNGEDGGIVRLNTDGSIDGSYGVGGKVVFNAYNFGASGEDNNIVAMALQPNGQLVVVGDSTFNPFVVARFNSNGTIDGSFGKGGRVSTQVQGAPFFQFTTNVALQADGRIVVVGTSDPGGLGNELAAIRVNTNGTLDTSFGNNGKFIAGFYSGAGTGGRGRDVAIIANGQILLAGSRTVGANEDFAVVRLNANGTYDGSFGTGGVSTVGINVGPGSLDDLASSMLVQADGKILLTGTASTSVFGNARFAAARFLPNGQLDGTFGIGGTNNYNVGIPATVGANASAFSIDGNLLLYGRSGTAMAIIKVDLAGIAGGGGGGGGGGAVGLIGSLLSTSTDGNQLIGYGVTGAGQYNPAIPLKVDLTTVFPGFTGVIRSAVGDVNGDTIPDFAVITGAGPQTQFAVLSGADQKTYIIAPTFPFRGSESFTGGGFITVGDMNGDGQAEVIVTPDQGGGPRVVVISYNGGSLKVLADFFGIADPGFRGGAETALGDINGDGVPDLVVAAGAGGGPRISIYSGVTFLTTRAKLIGDFFALPDVLRDGVNVAVGDVDGDGFGDLVFGAGNGGASQMFVVSGKTTVQNGIVAALKKPINNFFVNGDNSSRGGVRVTVKNVDGDKFADVVTGSGAGQQSKVRVYLGQFLAGGGGEPGTYQDLDPYGTPLASGIYVG